MKLSTVFAAAAVSVSADEDAKFLGKKSCYGSSCGNTYKVVEISKPVTSCGHSKCGSQPDYLMPLVLPPVTKPSRVNRKMISKSEKQYICKIDGYELLDGKCVKTDIVESTLGCGTGYVNVDGACVRFSNPIPSCPEGYHVGFGSDGKTSCLRSTFTDPTVGCPVGYTSDVNALGETVCSYVKSVPAQTSCPTKTVQGGMCQTITEVKTYSYTCPPSYYLEGSRCIRELDDMCCGSSKRYLSESAMSTFDSETDSIVDLELPIMEGQAWFDEPIDNETEPTTEHITYYEPVREVSVDNWSEEDESMFLGHRKGCDGGYECPATQMIQIPMKETVKWKRVKVAVPSYKPVRKMKSSGCGACAKQECYDSNSCYKKTTCYKSNCGKVTECRTCAKVDYIPAVPQCASGYYQNGSCQVPQVAQPAVHCPPGSQFSADNNSCIRRIFKKPVSTCGPNEELRCTSGSCVCEFEEEITPTFDCTIGLLDTETNRCIESSDMGPVCKPGYTLSDDHTVCSRDLVSDPYCTFTVTYECADGSESC